MSTTLSASKPTARKTHTCVWCGEIIIIGTKYSRWTGIHDGEFQSSAMHLECEQAFRDSEWDEFYPFEQMRGSTCEKGCGCEEHKEEDGK